MRILVVEDEKALAELVSDRLKRDHYAVDISNDGEEGMDNALSGMYDLIILDIMLPKVDGITILKEIRKLDKEVKVIMLTANVVAGAKENYIREGFTDYLTKPIRQSDLKQMLMDYLPLHKVHKEDA